MSDVMMVRIERRDRTAPDHRQSLGILDMRGSSTRNVGNAAKGLARSDVRYGLGCDVCWRRRTERLLLM